MTQRQTQAGHTPGPWDYQVHTNGENHIVYIHGKTIADVFCYETAEDEANARLIASAPCLLAALELAVFHAERMNALLPEESRQPEEQLYKARAAIAKARGSQ